jgi:hypothetical protein
MGAKIAELRVNLSDRAAFLRCIFCNVMEEIPVLPSVSTESRSFQNAITKRELGNEADKAGLGMKIK